MKGLQGGTLFLAHGTADGTHVSSVPSVFIANQSLKCNFHTNLWCALLREDVSRFSSLWNEACPLCRELKLDPDESRSFYPEVELTRSPHWFACLLFLRSKRSLSALSRTHQTLNKDRSQLHNAGEYFALKNNRCQSEKNSLNRSWRLNKLISQGASVWWVCSTALEKLYFKDNILKNNPRTFVMSL